jgi:hypothetical protein
MIEKQGKASKFTQNLFNGFTGLPSISTVKRAMKLSCFLLKTNLDSDRFNLAPLA